MRITVEMDVEEFEKFRAFQKDENSLCCELNQDLRSLENKHENLCTKLLDALDIPTFPAESPEAPGITIKDERKLLEAADLAGDWFA